MGRGGNFTKSGTSKSFKEALKRFLEQRFDWIVLLSITLIILFVLVLF